MQTFVPRRRADRAGRELAYAEVTSDVGAGAISGLSGTAPSGSRPIMVIVTAQVYNATASTATYIDLYEDGVHIGRRGHSSAGVNGVGSISIRRRRAASASSRVYTANVAGTGTPHAQGGDGVASNSPDPVTLQILEL